jgi:hypothetical protein
MNSARTISVPHLYRSNDFHQYSGGCTGPASFTITLQDAQSPNDDGVRWHDRQKRSSDVVQPWQFAFPEQRKRRVFPAFQHPLPLAAGWAAVALPPKGGMIRLGPVRPTAGATVGRHFEIADGKMAYGTCGFGPIHVRGERVAGRERISGRVGLGISAFVGASAANGSLPATGGQFPM